MSTAIIPPIARSEYLRPLAAIGICLLISLWLQIQVSPGPMTLGEDTWQFKLDTHLNAYPFSIRPLQSYSTLGLHTLTGIPVRESFFMIQFTLAILLGLAFYRLMRQMRFSPGWSLTGLILLMTAYPILGAHWAPTHTWDDFWAYLFLVLAFSAGLRRQAIWSGLWLCVSILSREPIIVFYPVLAYLILSRQPALDRVRLIVGLALPVLFFLGMRYFFTQPMDQWRWPITLMGNFLTPLRRSDAIASTIISFGVMWLLSALGLVRLVRQSPSTDRSWLVWAALIAVPATVVLTYAGALVRETRILFPPFVCIIPLSVIALQESAKFWKRRLSRSTLAILLIVVILCTAAGVTAANLVLFPRFNYTTNERVRRPLAGVHLGAIVAIGGLLWYEQSKRKHESL